MSFLIETMKYFFAAIAFFSIGYVLPTFSPYLQVGVAVGVLLFLAVSLCYYLDTRVFAVRLHQNAAESIPDHYL